MNGRAVVVDVHERPFGCKKPFRSRPRGHVIQLPAVIRDFVTNLQAFIAAHKVEQLAHLLSTKFEELLNRDVVSHRAPYARLHFRWLFRIGQVDKEVEDVSKVAHPPGEHRD